MIDFTCHFKNFQTKREQNENVSKKKSSASKCYITEDYFLSYFIFVYNMLK